MAPLKNNILLRSLHPHCVILLSLIVLIGSQDTCLVTNNAEGLPFFQGYSGSAARPERRIHHQNQAIIPSYRFNCCGMITAWGVDLSPAEANVTFDFELQVWRPSPTANETSGCYSLIDNFIVRSTSLPTQPESENVARVAPSPQDQLQFQPGDVLGFYVESQGTDSNNDNGVVLLDSANYTRELVWHASITSRTSQSGSCPYPIGTGGVLSLSTRAAPVISISISTHSSTCSITITRARSPAPAQPRPSVSTSGDSLRPNTDPGAFVSTALFAGLAVPLVLLFGAVNVATIVIVILLYCKIRRLQKSVHSNSEATHYSSINMPNKQAFPQVEDHYDSPDMYSSHLIRATKNIAYSGTTNREVHK